MSIGTLQARGGIYVREHGNDATVSAVSTLRAQRVVIEAQIEALNNFLHE